MKKKVKIFDILGVIDFLKSYQKDIDIFYLKKTFLLKILFFFLNIKKFKELKWEYTDYIGSIVDNHKKDEFIFNFLEEFEKKNKIERNFYHYLVRYFSLNKIISFMNLEEFLVFMKHCNLTFKDFEIVFYLEKNEFNKMIEKNFKNNQNSFIFYSRPLKFFFIKKIKYLIKNFLYVLKTKDSKNLNEKSICVMDSYDMNKPDFFFSNKKFYDKIIFITREKIDYFNESININHYINLKIYYYLISLYLKYNILFRSYQLIDFLFVNYKFEKKIYFNFFQQNKIKVFLTSQINQPYISSAVAAINDLGGDVVGYTMSFEESYTSSLNIDSINYFISFNNSKHIKFSHSNLKEILPIGYITDYKFLKRKNEAIELRKKILETDAKYIIGLFDQGSQLDNKWEVSHKISSITYKFLLKKIIEDKNFALIIKPKKPKLLREKLGTEYELLIRAKNTGRCIIFDNYSKHNVKNFEDIPAKVAMAADLTIHDTLAAGTAGLESALTGTRSVYFDYLDLKKSQFDERNLNIVYRNWDVLWKDIEKDFEKRSEMFGNWEKIINKFDNFRDGKTNIRMMDFVNKLIEKKAST